MNNKRFAFKFLGAFMEAVNFSPKELRRTLWVIGFCLVLVVFVWRLPDILAVWR